MKILRALLFPLRRPLRLAALGLAQSLFLWLVIAAFEAAYRDDANPGNLESIAILGLFFGSLLCNAFWLHGSSVASLQRAIAGQKSLAVQRASHFKPRGIGPAIASLVHFVYFVLFLALVAVPAQVPEMLWRLSVMTPVELCGVVASPILVFVPGTLLALMFFVSMARYAAEGIGWRIDVRAAGLFHPRKNLASTLRYVMRQYFLLGLAALGFALGLQLVAEIMPQDLSAPLDGARATTWWVIAFFAGSAVVHYFWHASLHLLADYVVETENTASS